jgi:multidrug efflux pump subunit AcrA (membrane-fusion protein)
LEETLAVLGSGDALVVDETFDAATADAVAAWEADLGRPAPDGRVEFGDVVFQPGPLRVASVETDLGSVVQAGTPVLTYTATTKVVTVALEADDSDLLAAGDGVTVNLPDGTTTAGTVERVAANASIDPGGPAAEDSPEVTPTVPVTITLDDPAAADPLATATVTVDVTRERREGALAAPVTALLALVEGGYAVQVPDDREPSGYRLVAVEPGLFADGWVEITGRGLTEGTEVVVPE